MIPSDRTRWTIRNVAVSSLARFADHAFVEEVEGRTETYEAFVGRASFLALFLRELGIGQGDVVASLLANRLAALHIWMATGLLGATEAPLHHNARGDMLRHALRLAGGSVVAVDRESIASVAECLADLPLIRHVLALDPTCPRPRLPDGVAWHAVDTAAIAPVPMPEAEVRPSDIASIMLTSGTSGPSKGVMMPNAQVCLIAQACIAATEADSADIFYCVHPLNHIAGKFMGVLATFATGGKVVLDRRFDAERWLERVRRHGATVSIAHGPMIEMIAARPASADDARHALDRLMCSPMPGRLAGVFEQRFGVRRIEMWGMTETGCATWTRLGDGSPRGSAGRLLTDWYDLQIVDPDTDEPVPVGAAGEIVVRSRHPFTMMAGYRGMPAETAASWRNLWFHTGDAARMDDRGNLYFIDRLKDRIRCRSENISSFDIESAATSHEAVVEAAAVGVPSAFAGDDDIALHVVLRPDTALAPEDLLRFMAGKLPHHMLPHFIAVTDRLPRTPTGKLRKAELRQRGPGAQAWDRRRSGVRLRALYPET